MSSPPINNRGNQPASPDSNGQTPPPPSLPTINRVGPGQGMRSLGVNAYAPPSAPEDQSAYRYAHRHVVPALQRPPVPPRPARNLIPPPVPPRQRQPYSHLNRMLTSAEYQRQWQAYAAPFKKGVESCLEILDPTLRLHKLTLGNNPPEHVENILGLAGDLAIDPASGDPILNADDRQLVDRNGLPAFLHTLDVASRYIMDVKTGTGRHHHSVVEHREGQWAFNDGAGWRPFLAGGTRTRQAHELLGLGEKEEWEAPQDYKRRTVKLFAVNDRRQQMLTDYTKEFYKTTAYGAEKVLRLHYEVDDADRKTELEKLYRPQQAAAIRTSEGRIPDIRAERCLYALDPSIRRLEPTEYANSDFLELMDAIIISEGSFTQKVNWVKQPKDAEEMYFFTKPSDQELQANLRRLNPAHKYIFRYGDTLGRGEYYQVYQENGVWFCDNGQRLALLDTDGNLTQAVKNLFAAFKGGSFTAIMLKATPQRIANMRKYAQDYRYQGPSTAIANMIRQNPDHENRGDFSLLGDIDYQDGRIFGYKKITNFAHKKDLLPAQSRHQWLPPGIVSAPHFARNDPFNYSRPARYARMRETCIDECVDFLSHMYNRPPTTLGVSAHHTNAQRGLEINSPVYIASENQQVEPLNQSGEFHLFNSGFSERGILHWLDGLDERMPYFVCMTDNSIPHQATSHHVVLFFYRGQWHIYNDVDHGAQGMRAPIRPITSPKCRDGQFVRHRLTDYGRELFYAPNADWETKRAVWYNPVDMTRLSAIRAWVNAIRNRPYDTAHNSAETEMRQDPQGFIRRWDV